MAGYSADVRPDQFLSNVSIAASNDETMMVGDVALPIIDVDYLSGQYPVYGQEEFKSYVTLRSPMSSAREIRQSLSKGTYTAKRHSAKTGVPDENIRFSAPPLDAQLDASIFVGRVMRNDRERTQLAVLADPTQMTQNITLSGTSLFSDYNNSVPLSVIRGARSAVRAGAHRPANTWLGAYDVDLVLADHPSVKDLLKGWDQNALVESGLPPVFRGLTVVESQADTDTIGPGSAAQAFAPMFSKALNIFYRNPNFGIRSLTLGATLRAPNPDSGGRGIETKSWRDEDKSGWWVESNDTYQPKIFAPNAAYLIAVAIA